MTVEIFLPGGGSDGGGEALTAAEGIGEVASSARAVISRLDGAILLVLFAGFILYAFKIARTGVFDELDVKVRGPGLTLLLIGGGLAGLALGGRFVVDAAVDAASMLGVSERLIAITIVSAGTSLPELFTSAVAAARGRNEIAVGNVVGSNIFNIMLILGVSAIIGPVPFAWNRFGIDLAVLTAATLLLFLTMFTGKRKVLDRWEAGVFVACFGGYMTWLIIAG
jgi:cation:H+ antiporter